MAETPKRITVDNRSDGEPFVLFATPPDSLEEAVQIAVGAASACWENLSGAGVFQDGRALEIADQLIAEILKRQAALLDQNEALYRALVAMDSGWTPPPHVPPQQVEFVQAALEELNHARAKHGDGCIDGSKWSDAQRLAIILEELGEVAKELNDEALGGKPGVEGGHLGRLLGELVQVAAMAIGWGARVMPGPAAQRPAEPTPKQAPGTFTTGLLGRTYEAYEPGSTVRVPEGTVAVMVSKDRLHEVLEMLDRRA